VPPHPAVFSEALYDVFLETLTDYGHIGDAILDPMAGTGGIHRLRTFGYRTVGVELEPGWARSHPGTLVGNAAALPFEDETFDFIITSPAFGNRLADHHEAKDPSHRRTYRHYLGHQLNPLNTGQFQWGQQYRIMHALIWYEARRVLRRGGYLVLDIKDHVRQGKRQHVSNWHYQYLWGLGFDLLDVIRVDVNNYGFGQNRELRLPERVLVFKESAS